MVRGFRRYRPRRFNTYRSRSRGSTYKSRYSSARRSINLVRGRKFRVRMRSKGSKWQKFEFYDVIYPAMDLTEDNAAAALTGQTNALMPALPLAPIPPGIPIHNHNVDARTAHFGPLYAPGGAGVLLQGNPTTVGDGMLAEIAMRDAVMGFTRWDYSSAIINAELIGDNWDARNNAGGPLIAVPSTAVFFKGIKINLLGRSTSMPGLMYMGYRKDANTPFKFRERVGKLRAYFPTKRSPVPVAAGARAFRWSLPEIYICGPLFTRVKVTAYYKVKGLTVN